MNTLVPAPDQDIEYIAVIDRKVVDSCIVNTSTSNFPALTAKQILSGSIAQGAELYVRVGAKPKRKEVN